MLSYPLTRPTFYVQSPTMTPFATLPTIPKTVTGFYRRFEADTKLIAKHKNHRAQLVLIRSWTLLKAERLGDARFVELLRKLGLSKRSPILSHHRLLAENAERLLPYAGNRLPTDIKTLCRLARLQEEVVHDFIVCRGPFPNITLDEYLLRRTNVGRFKGHAHAANGSQLSRHSRNTLVAASSFPPIHIQSSKPFQFANTSSAIDSRRLTPPGQNVILTLIEEKAHEH